MKRVLVFAVCISVFLGFTALVSAWDSGNGDEDMPTPTGGCSNGVGCHGTWSGNGTVTLAAVADDGVWNTPGESGTVTATVNIDAANSDGEIVGAMVLDSDMDDNIKAAGWTITDDPNSNSTPYNYNEKSSAVGDVDLMWSVNAPDSTGTYHLVGRLLFDDGGARHNQSRVVEIVLVVGVSEEESERGLTPAHELVSYPNPFRQSTTISYQLTAAGRVSLRVYDTAGRLVRSLADGQTAKGTITIAWDGRDNLGREVPGGLYFCILQAGDAVSTGKTVLVR